MTTYWIKKSVSLDAMAGYSKPLYCLTWKEPYFVAYELTYDPLLNSAIPCGHHYAGKFDSLEAWANSPNFIHWTDRSWNR